MCGNCFFPGFREFFDAVFGCRDKGFRDDRGKRSRLIAIHEVEWGHIGDRMGAVIVCEFGSGEAVSPRKRIVLAKDLKVDL